MISPHGGKLVNKIIEAPERDRLLASASRLPKIELDAWALSDVEMIAIGGFSPLEGFITRTDYESVVLNRRLKNGLVWTIPVTLSVNDSKAKELKSDAALTQNGNIVAILHIEDAYNPDKTIEAEKVFGTKDGSHPGVARLNITGNTYIGGKI